MTLGPGPFWCGNGEQVSCPGERVTPWRSGATRGYTHGRAGRELCRVLTARNHKGCSLWTGALIIQICLSFNWKSFRDVLAKHSSYCAKPYSLWDQLGETQSARAAGPGRGAGTAEGRAETRDGVLHRGTSADFICRADSYTKQFILNQSLPSSPNHVVAMSAWRSYQAASPECNINLSSWWMLCYRCLPRLFL